MDFTEMLQTVSCLLCHRAGDNKLLLLQKCQGFSLAPSKKPMALCVPSAFYFLLFLCLFGGFFLLAADFFNKLRCAADGLLYNKDQNGQQQHEEDKHREDFHKAHKGVAEIFHAVAERVGKAFAVADLLLRGILGYFIHRAESQGRFC